MKYALIGCGRISTNHVKAVVNNKLEFVAACDVVPEHIENVLAKHGLENDTSIKRYTDYKKMIEENEIELVGIATESVFMQRLLCTVLSMESTVLSRNRWQ